MLKYLMLSVLLGWLSLSTGWAAEIQVAVDRNPVSINDSFQLVFTTSTTPDDDPDFAPLQQQFEILNQQRSHQSSWVNGNSQRSLQWHLTLMARQSGELLIPPIAFGKDLSKALKLTVTEKNTQPDPQDDLFLEVAVDSEHPYQQSQVIYTVKLYRRVELAQASLDEPELNDAVIERLGDDVSYSTQIKGVNYAVTERKYAMFPQQSGVMVIPPLKLNAEVLSSRASRQGFWGQMQTETRRLVSKAIQLTVQPVPEAFKNQNWLTAETLQLTEQWSDNRREVKVGEPLTRTITLTAKGSTVAQLPELMPAPALDGIKTYPDQPQLHEQKQPDGLLASRAEKQALIATKAGDYQLPELVIPWFNTRTGKQELARLPAVTIKALAVAEAEAEAPSQLVAATEPKAADNAGAEQIRFWQALSVFLAAGWFLTVLWLLVRNKPGLLAADDGNKPVTRQLNQQNARQSLQQACEQHQPRQARQALLDYFAADNLAQIAARSPELAEPLAGLGQHLYAAQAQSWQGDLLWQAFLAVESRSQSAAKPADSSLEPLFKI